MTTNPISNVIGKKVTVRDVLPLLQNACMKGVQDFFSSIMPQQEGQHPLDRELFINNENFGRLSWVLSGLDMPIDPLWNLAYNHKNRHDQQPIPLQPNDPLYPTMLYMINSIGNIIQPNTRIDHTYANEFCSDDLNHREVKFTHQFSKLDVFGLIVHSPQNLTWIDYEESSDYGAINFGDTSYMFDTPNNRSKTARFACDGKRHNVSKFYAKKFFEHRKLVEAQIKEECGK